MHDNLDADPDVIAYTLQVARALLPAISDAQAKQIEDDVKGKYGGRRFYIPKGAKRLTPQQRAALYKDGLTATPTEAIVEKHGVSRATIYRLMKDGGGRFS